MDDISADLVEDILHANGKRVIDTPFGRFVFTETDNGDFEWNREESENVEAFPPDDLLTAIEATLKDDAELVDIFPVTFSVYAHDDKNTTRFLKSGGLPTDDEGLIDLFWNYPGELEITYELDKVTDGIPDHISEYDLSVVEIEYEGTTFTPE